MVGGVHARPAGPLARAPLLSRLQAAQPLLLPRAHLFSPHPPLPPAPTLTPTLTFALALALAPTATPVRAVQEEEGSDSDGPTDHELAARFANLDLGCGFF